jgi:hypothetical protein
MSALFTYHFYVCTVIKPSQLTIFNSIPYSGLTDANQLRSKLLCSSLVDFKSHTVIFLP